MEVTGRTVWQVAQALSQQGMSGGPELAASGSPAQLPPDDGAAADFNRALEGGRVARDAVVPPLASMPRGGSSDGMHVGESGPVTLGDAILRGLTAMGRDIASGWQRAQVPLAAGPGGLPSASEMFTRQVEIARTAFTLEVASKGASKTVEHVNQIVKQQ